jgi:hypothetical protein
VPWTRVVTARKTTYKGEVIDLPEFISRNKDKLVLKPNDASTDHHAYAGWETDQQGWNRAIHTALRNSYVVQEKVEPMTCLFPLLQFGSLEMKQMAVDVQPHAYIGKVQGCSSWLTDASGARFSTLTGLAPTFLLEPKS